jgi:hypothetical protein
VVSDAPEEKPKKRKRVASMNSDASVSTRTRRKSEDKTPIVVEMPDKDKIKDYKFVRIDPSKFEGKISSQF